MIKTTKIGKVGLTFEGDYNASKSYANKTCVLHDHISWVSRKDVPIGIVPGTNEEYWQKVSDRGAHGEKGDKGDKGSAAYMSFNVDSGMHLVFNQISSDGELDLGFSVDDNGNLIITKE